MTSAVNIHVAAAANISPSTRKRKAAEATITSPTGDEPANKRVIASAARIAAPPTPVTTGMDSEEDFMSPGSSEDEFMNDDSGDALSGPDGTVFIPSSNLVHLANNH